MTQPTPIGYHALPARGEPRLLARVRWPDVAQAISERYPEWQDDPGLFDLPDDPSSRALSFGEAASIAAGWGVEMKAEGPYASCGPAFIRRMPANWSDMAPAERRAWGLEPRQSDGPTDRRPPRGRPRHAPSGNRRTRWVPAPLDLSKVNSNGHANGKANGSHPDERPPHP